MDNLQGLHEAEIKSVYKYGYFIHYVPDAKTLSGVDIHTHHLGETLKHKELSIALAIPKKVASVVIESVVEVIRDGTPLVDGMKLDGIIRDYDVMIKEINDHFRIIFPDSSGRFPEDKDCDPFYAAQILEEPTF